MPRIVFTRHLESVGPTAPEVCPGATLAELLDSLASEYPRLKSYVLDDQGRVRKHIAVFVDGDLRPRDTVLSAPLAETSDVYVFQALSGG